MRTVVSGVTPSVDGGSTVLKRVVGDELVVEADVVADGHDQLSVQLRWRHDLDRQWRTTPMAPIGNDRYAGRLTLDRLGRHHVAIWSAVDPWATWRHGLAAKRQAGVGAPVDLLVGASILDDAVARLPKEARPAVADAAAHLRAAADRQDGHGGDDHAGARGAGGGARAGDRQAPQAPDAGAAGAPDPGAPDPGAADAGAPGAGAAGAGAPDDEQDGGPSLGLAALDPVLAAWPDAATVFVHPAATVWVDRPLAGASAWYELFPRSASPVERRPGTLSDVIDRLPYVAGLGFDVVYLPPIHPIGRTHRKGRNGARHAATGDPGSPWAIGAAEGGHCAVDPALGTLQDLRRLVTAARGHGLEVALDLAFQCSPDHPWVAEHPEWFRRLPDGTVAYAENPPKTYEDIYPFDFDSPDWPALWSALADVVRHWVDQGITVFRVDNPHTKPLRFWEWMIDAIHHEHPEVLFLAEAFTRPRLLEHLAKVGFSQSYTYFTWRVAKWEIEQYLTEVSTTDVAEYLRPNFWPNTPDILPVHLQEGGRAAFVARLVLAATGGASYGIYGPVFELQEHLPRAPGTEEYLDSEKYEVRHWDLDRPGSLAGVVTLVNSIRRAHRALRQQRCLAIVPTDNDHLVAFAKWAGPAGASAGTDLDVPGGEDSPAGTDVIMTVVNLDPRHTQSGWVDIDLERLGLAADEPFVAHDLLSDTRFEWRDRSNYVSLDPASWPAHILHLHRLGPQP